MLAYVIAFAAGAFFSEHVPFSTELGSKLVGIIPGDSGGAGIVEAVEAGIRKQVIANHVAGGLIVAGGLFAYRRFVR